MNVNNTSYQQSRVNGIPQSIVAFNKFISSTMLDVIINILKTGRNCLSGFTHSFSRKLFYNTQKYKFYRDVPTYMHTYNSYVLFIFINSPVENKKLIDSSVAI